MQKFYWLFVAMLLCSLVGFSQVTTNGGAGLAPTYPNLNAAITALNSAIINSPIVITLTGNETAPPGGYSITAQGTAVNTIVIEGSSSTITASGAQVVGSLSDAIFKLVGADFVTIRQFTMRENTANTITAAATNNMTEWGVALLYASTTNGTQNCTLQNNDMSLNRAYPNTFGIYSNSTHTATAPTISITATSVAGSNNGLQVYANTISNVNNGIVVIGPTAGANHNDRVDIGGSSAATGNTVINFGNTGTFSGFANVSASVNGILVRNAKSINVSYNTITSAIGANGVLGGELRGISVPTFPGSATGIFEHTFNNNTIALTSHSGGVIIGIGIEASTSNNTSGVTINNNNFTRLNHTVASVVAPITAISLAGNSLAGPLRNTINGNTFTNLTTNTTGTFIFISNNWTKPANAITTVNNNAIVTGFSKTGSGGLVRFYYSNGFSPSTCSETNSGNDFSNVTLTGSTSMAGWQCYDGDLDWPYGSFKTVTNNRFTNITVGSGQTSVLGVGYSRANTVAVGSVSNNTIHTVNVGGNLYGLGTGVGNLQVTNNTIYGLSTTAPEILVGLTISDGNDQVAAYNKIYDLLGSNTFSRVTGILVRGSNSVTLVNNIIGQLRAPIANLANGLIGIDITGGTYVNVHYNTVYLNANSSGALFGSSALSANTTSNLTLRNNILVNNSTANGTGRTVVYRRGDVTLSSYAEASDNNLFYAGTPSASNLIFSDGTNSDQTLAAYKNRVMGRDVFSVTENPPFASTTGSAANFLHINPAIPTQVERAGAPIPHVVEDFDGDARNPSRPDIGADEFNGTNIDLTGPGITYTPIDKNFCPDYISLAPVVITDLNGVDSGAINRPRLYFKKIGHANTFIDNTSATNGWKYVTANGTGGSPYSFSTSFALLFGGTGAVPGDTIQYFVVAQDLAAIPNVGINRGIFASAPASVALTSAAFPISGNINRYTINKSYAGTVTIGAMGNFSTLTNSNGLFDVINNTGMNGNLVAEIIDTNIVESGAFALNAVNYTGCGTLGPFTLTIKPAAGVTATVHGTVPSGSIIKLSGADNVIVDGSNSGGSDRSLTIRNNTTTSSGNAVVWLAAPATNNGSSKNTIKNCIIEGNASNTSFIGMYVGGNTSITTTAAGFAMNSDNTIVNNLFRKTQYGLVMYGYSTATPDQNNTVSNNLFGTSVTGEGFLIEGIRGERQEGLQVRDNEVQQVRGAPLVNGMYGIRLLDVKNAVCVRNKVHDLMYNGTSGAKIYGIALQSPNFNTSGNPSNALVANNFVYAINSSGIGLVWCTTGMLASSGFGDRYYHNTLDLGGQLSNSTSGLTAVFANGDGNITDHCTQIDVRNNIFHLRGTSIGGNVWTYYTKASNFTGATVNYNLLRCAGTGASNNTGHFNNLNYTTLANWQAATGMDANSLHIPPPVFVSATDLHLNPFGSAYLDNLGTALAAVTNDIDGEMRSVTTPDIGADEFSSPPCATVVGGTGSPNLTGCVSFTGTISATGFSTGLGSTYQWVVAPNPNGPWTAISGANNPYAYTISPPITTTAYYRLAVACPSAASVDSSSVIAIAIVANPTVPVTPAGPITICAPGTQTLSASGTNAATPTFAWLRNNVAISGATSATFGATTAGSYRVRVTDGVTGCFDTSAIVMLNVNPQPANPTATATPDTVCIGGNVNLTSSASAGYNINAAGTETFIDIDANPTVTSIASLLDDSEHNISMPRFTFNGITYTTARVGMNGAIALGSTSGDISTGNAALPTTTNSAGNLLIMPWWDDLDIQSSPATTIKLDTVGSKFIIQYTNVVHNFTTASTVKFQIQMDTANGHIHFVYNDVDFGDVLYSNGISGTVGVQWNGTAAAQYSFNTALLTAGQCITFTPATLGYAWSGPNGFTSSLQNPTLTNVSSLDSGTYQVIFTNVATGCTDTAFVNVYMRPTTTSEWIGAVNTDWNTAGNWACGNVPTATSNVIIRSSAPNYPVINQNVEIRRLTVRTGASVTVGAGFELKLNGN